MTLFDDFGEHDFNLNKEDWNEDYMNRQMVSIVDDFTKERLNHLKEVVKYVYRDKIKESYIDIDYLTAIAEATEYEFEMCMENLNYTTRLDLLQYN